MNSLNDAVKYLKDAVENEKENNHSEALGNYQNAVKHFEIFTMNEDTLVPDLKEQIQYQIDYCKDHFKKIKGKEIQSSANNSDAIKYPTSFLPKKNLKFDDLCGMETIKTDLTLALITPLKRPKVYSRGLKPYRGFLLFGVPGTGKSSIAQAVAEEAGGLNFFYISASDILSKYIGESERRIRNLFEIARSSKPSIIFIDEIDAMASKRTEVDHSRGTKTELFVQMDSVLGITDSVFLMASTNCPQHLDSAILRRFDKLIYVPLPDEGERMDIFKKKVSDIKCEGFSEDKFKGLAVKTNGFSPSDIEKICISAKNMSLKRLLKKNPVKKCGNEVEGEPSNHECECCTPILLYEDVLQALSEANPSVDPEEVRELEDFAKERGDGYGKVYNRESPEPTTCCQLICNCIVSPFD